MNLLLVEPAEVDANGRVRLADARAHHLRSVLDVVLDQAVRVGVVDGPVGSGRVIAMSDDSIELECTFAETPPRPAVDLLLALPRPKVLRRLWAQVAALGVGRILLTNAARVERNYFDTHVLDPRVYRPLLVEGLQQARDTRLPLVSVHRQFRILVEDELDRLAGAGLRLLADPAADAAIIATVAEGSTGERVLIAIGPEGGWNDFERELLRAHRFSAVAMGQRTLRSDTATIALLALVHEACRLRGADVDGAQPRAPRSTGSDRT